ncbi:hypothetical protein OAK04_01000 [Verrucomicrobia bacterium]|nr:hypothetical protein [Verrucomicrobiota bacterium]
MTKADARDLRNKDFKSLNDEVERREMTPFDAESKISAMAPAVGFEPTGPLLKINELVSNTHLYTHSDCVELTEIIEKWPKLPKEIRDAILAIVSNSRNN